MVLCVTGCLSFFQTCPCWQPDPLILIVFELNFHSFQWKINNKLIPSTPQETVYDANDSVRKVADWHIGPLGRTIHFRGWWKTPFYQTDLSLFSFMLKHHSGGQACLASLSANVTANYDSLFVPQRVSVGVVRSVRRLLTDELGSDDPCSAQGCCMKVIAPISWAAGLHRSDKSILVKYGGSVGVSEPRWPAGVGVWCFTQSICLCDTFVLTAPWVIKSDVLHTPPPSIFKGLAWPNHHIKSHLMWVQTQDLF